MSHTSRREANHRQDRCIKFASQEFKYLFNVIVVIVVFLLFVGLILVVDAISILLPDVFSVGGQQQQVVQSLCKLV